MGLNSGFKGLSGSSSTFETLGTEDEGNIILQHGDKMYQVT